MKLINQVKEKVFSASLYPHSSGLQIAASDWNWNPPTLEARPDDGLVGPTFRAAIDRGPGFLK